MADPVYRVTKEGSGDWSIRKSEAGILLDTGRRMKRNGGPFRLFNFKTGEWTKTKKQDVAIADLKNRITHDRLWDYERVKCHNGAVLRLRRVRPAEPAPTGPHDRAKLEELVREFYDTCEQVDPNGEYWGGYVCRRASHNASIWSTHAFGEAIDWHRSSMEKGDAIKSELKRKFGNRVTVVWRSTAHFDHLHIEVDPSRTGDPCGR